MVAAFNADLDLEGLAAEKVGKSLQFFRAAVEADPLHYLAGASLAVALIAVGERDAAHRQADAQLARVDGGRAAFGRTGIA